MRSESLVFAALILGMSTLLNSCYIVDFFHRKNQGSEGEGDSLEVLGDDLGSKAGGRDTAALAAVYAVSAVNPPAAVRPDPDLLVRRLLRQFRPEGTTLARAIGEVENYRVLLGGASTDFATAPANGYDATSVLTTMKVAEEVCRALVAPSEWNYPGWQTILPAPVSDVTSNLQYLVQRITGVATADIPNTKIEKLTALFESAASEEGQASGYEAYVAPCTAVVVDAQAMLM